MFQPSFTVLIERTILFDSFLCVLHFTMAPMTYKFYLVSTATSEFPRNSRAALTVETRDYEYEIHPYSFKFFQERDPKGIE